MIQRRCDQGEAYGLAYDVIFLNSIVGTSLACLHFLASAVVYVTSLTPLNTCFVQHPMLVDGQMTILANYQADENTYLVAAPILTLVYFAAFGGLVSFPPFAAMVTNGGFGSLGAYGPILSEGLKVLHSGLCPTSFNPLSMALVAACDR